MGICRGLSEETVGDFDVFFPMLLTNGSQHSYVIIQHVYSFSHTEDAQNIAWQEPRHASCMILEFLPLSLPSLCTHKESDPDKTSSLSCLRMVGLSLTDRKSLNL